MSVKSLSIMSVKYPKIKFDNKQRVFVVFYHNNKRYRLSNGSKVNIAIYPNSYPISKREEVANLLAAEVFKYISSGLNINEALHYMEHKDCGVNGFVSMKGWKNLSNDIRAKVPLNKDSEELEDAINSWYQEEADVALILSRNLGVLAKTPIRNEVTLKKDKTKLIKDFCLSGQVSIKDAVSDIKILVDFERRSVSLKNSVSPPKNIGTVARITWLKKQIENCIKTESTIFEKLNDKVWIEADVKFARENLKVNFNNIEELYELTKGKDIQRFYVSVIDGFGSGFSSEKKFVTLFEQLILNYYEGILQNLKNWTKPAPKLNLSE